MDNSNVAYTTGMDEVIKHLRDSASEEYTFPDTLERLEFKVFDRIRLLKRIVIPASVKEICYDDSPNYEPNGFYLNHYKCVDTDYQSNLEEIIVSEDNPYFTIIDGVVYSKDLEELYFYPPKAPKEDFTVPNTVRVIKNGAFVGNTHIKSITLPDSCKTIERYAFADTTSLLQINLDNVITIGPQAFYRSGIINANLRSAENIGPHAFDGCRISNVCFEAIEEIGECAFRNTHVPTLSGELIFPETLKVIGDAAFLYNNFETVKLPRSVTMLGSGCLEGAKCLHVYDNVESSLGWAALLDTDYKNQLCTVYVYKQSDDTLKFVVPMINDESVISIYRDWKRTKSFDFSKLDTQFPKIKNKTVKTTIAQIRLQYPTDISKKTKREYTDYLTKQKMAIPQPGL